MKSTCAMNCIGKYLFVGINLASLVLASCSPEPTPVPTLEMPTLALPTATAAAPTQTISPPSPTQQPPASTTTPVPECPSPTEGTQLLRNERMGYCLLYPADYFEAGLPHAVSIAPEGFVFWESPPSVGIGVLDASGRNVRQLADKRITQLGFDPGRSSLTIGGEEAVVLADVGGQASLREVLIVHEDRLYTLGFILPDPEDSPGIERFERFYDTVINSFTFVPISVSPQAIPEESQGNKGSAVVAFVKDGDVQVWEEATGQTETIFESGDVIRVELSHDGQLVAFVRRFAFEAGGLDNHQKSSLWVMRRNGEDPRELVSAEQLRTQLNAAETESTNFPRLEWVPNSHRLLYSGDTYDNHGYGEGAHTPTRGIYIIDADSLEQTELAPADRNPAFEPSPDGQQVALLTPTGLSFINVDGSHRRQDILAYPASGVPGSVIPLGVWTQDSSAFLLAAPSETETRRFTKFTIWHVPSAGAQALPLLTVDDTFPIVIFAPDGSGVVFTRWASTGGQGEAISGTFITPLAKDMGPLASPAVTDIYGPSIWSPNGSAYVLEAPELQDLFQLCPNASQLVEVCGPPIHFDAPVDYLNWIDNNHFLYVTREPRWLYLGALDGSSTPIAHDPLSFTVVAATCRNDSEFVTDVTVPDGTPFATDTLFRKTWRVRNTGTCTWDSSYRLTFLAGDRMSGPRSVPLADEVQPGEEIDLSVMLIAPDAGGTYQGQWQLFAPNGNPFGTAPYVVIQVP